MQEPFASGMIQSKNVGGRQPIQRTKNKETIFYLSKIKDKLSTAERLEL